jgi:CHAD domain-containing protein
LSGNTIAIAGAAATPARSRLRSGKGKLRLRRNVPLREALLAAFSGVMRAARRSAAASEDPMRSVHDFRKSIRRARSVVALLQPALGQKTAAGLVAELRRALAETSALRDDDVLAATLTRIAGDDPELFVEAAHFTAALSAGAPRHRPETLARAVPILRPLLPALTVVLPRRYSTPDLEKGLSRCYRRAQRTLEQARRTGEDADFHEWRKRLKELRYVVELLASTGSRPLKAREKVFGDLARDLGEATDLAVLCGRLEAPGAADTVSPEGGSPGSRLLERARLLQRDRVQALLARGAPLFTQAPGAFALEILAERG